jgi:hypothetical protein
MKKQFLALALSLATLSFVQAGILDSVRDLVSGHKDTSSFTDTKTYAAKKTAPYIYGSAKDRVERWRKVRRAFDGYTVRATENDKKWAEHNFKRAESALNSPLAKQVRKVTRTYHPRDKRETTREYNKDRRTVRARS